MEENMERNFKWFLKHYDEIYDICGECYVIIKDQKIIKIFFNYKQACEFYDNNNLKGFANFQYCNGNESGYTTYINTNKYVFDLNLNENIKHEYPEERCIETKLF